MLPTRLRTLQSLESAITRFERWSISFVVPDLRVTSSALHITLAPLHYTVPYAVQCLYCALHRLTDD